MFTRAYVEITNVCNLQCCFCPGTARAPGYMTPADFRTAAQRLRGYTPYLYFHVMGEPLLHPQLPALMAIAGELGFRVCLTTNGTLLGEKLPALTSADALHKLSVSLHSFEGNEGGGELEAYLSSVWAGCAALSRRGVLCALRLWNQGGSDALNGEIYRFLSLQLGADVSALPADPMGNRRLGEKLYLESARRFDWPHPDAQPADVQFCHGLRRQIAVLCDGTVVPCCLDGEGRIPLGNLLREDLDTILASPRAQALRDGFFRRQPSEALCRHCGYAARFNR